MTFEKLQEIYDHIPTYIKDAVGFPDNFNLLTNDQQRFIMDLYIFDRMSNKKELLEIIEEMKGIIDEI